MASASLSTKFSYHTPDDRLAQGRALRGKLGRAEHGKWTPSKNRANPVTLLMGENTGRQSSLLPTKFDRMKASPFGFFRGAAPLMAADLALMKSTGLRVQLCGDAHVKNLGAYAAPDGQLVFDLNDFDETISGPWEWDVKRLAASIVLAGRDAKDRLSDCRKAVLEFSAAYRNALWLFSKMKALDLMKHPVLSGMGNEIENELVQRVLKKAERATPDRNLAKLTLPAKNGWRRFHTATPMSPVTKETAEKVLASLASYRETLGASRRLTLDAYNPYDVAFKIVGTGSVGTLDYVILLYGNGPADPLFLQVKQALPSCYAKYLPDALHYSNQGQRIADGQYCLQTVTDPFVGWTSFDGKDFLVRQLADHKASIDPAELSGEALIEYGVLCGKMLARAHARTGDAAMIAGYCGNADKLDLAIANFAVAYAEQTLLDYDLFCKCSNDELLKMVPDAVIEKPSPKTTSAAISSLSDRARRAARPRAN